MQKQRVKTSMSVPEMGKMLGLGKVESYWLVKKNYFKTIQVAGRMRVMLDALKIGMPASSTIKKWMVHRPERNGGILRCQFRKWRIFWG